MSSVQLPVALADIVWCEEVPTGRSWPFHAASRPAYNFSFLLMKADLQVADFRLQVLDGRTRVPQLGAQHSYLQQ